MKNQHDVEANNFLVIRASYGVEMALKGGGKVSTQAEPERIQNVAQVLNPKTGRQPFFLNS